jgi:hypothetical protein
MTLVINTFLTVSFITFGNGVLNNPNLFNVAIFTLIVIMQTILFFGDIEKKMINALYLVGAYGRQYNTKELMIKDWLDGKDFRIKGGQYISIRDMHFVNKLDNVYLDWQSPKHSDEYALVNVEDLK